MNKLNRIALAVLLVGCLFLTGCSTHQPTDKNLYGVLYYLNNLDSNTPTELNPDYSQYSHYKFIHNLPGGGPEYYSAFYYFIPPSDNMAGGLVLPVVSQFNQTFHLYVNNPSKENYKRLTSFYRAFRINYIKQEDDCGKFAFDQSSDETISNDAFFALNPEDKKSLEFNIGGPYTPGSVEVITTPYNYVMKFKNEIFGSNNSFIQKRTLLGATCNGREVSFNLESPKYELYENGVLIEKRNITQEYYNSDGEVNDIEWNKNYLTYYFPSESSEKQILVNITIPSYYPLFNYTRIIAEFNTGKLDKNPPYIEDIQIKPRFEQGENLEVKFYAYDDISLASYKVYYRVNGIWKEIASSKVSNRITASSIASGEFIDLRIELTDSSLNKQTYIIESVSASKKDLNIELYQDKNIISPGTRVRFFGEISDQNTGVGSLLISGLFNGKEVLRSYTMAPYINDNEEYIQGGNFSFYFDVPKDYVSGSNFSIVFGGSGIYPKKEYLISGFVQKLNNDAAITGIKTNDYISLGKNKINASVVNVGNNIIQNAKVNLYYACYYEDICSERYLMDTEIISLGIGESKLVELEGEIGEQYNTLKIIAEVEYANDENNLNNEFDKIMPLFVNFDAEASALVDSIFYAGEYKNITIEISNTGLNSLNNIGYSVYYSPAENMDYKTLLYNGNIEYLKRGELFEKLIPLKFYETGDYYIYIQIDSTQDQNPNNNLYTEFFSLLNKGPNLVSYLKSSNNIFEVNKEIELIMTVNNKGTESAQSSAKLYYQKGGCNYRENECNDLELLFSKDEVLGIGAESTYKYNFTTAIDGVYVFVLVAETEKETYEKDNAIQYNEFIKKPGADLSGSIEIYRLFAGEVSDIEVYSENSGTEKALANISLFYQIGACDYKGGMCNNLKIINSENMTIEPYSGKHFILQFIPENTGEYTFVLTMNASNEAYPKDNFYSGVFYSRATGPDPFVEHYYNSNMPIQGKTYSTRFFVGNKGNRDSGEIKFSAYISYYDPDLREDVTKLITTKTIQGVKQDSYEEVNVSWIPEKAEYTHIIANISSGSDSDYENNIIDAGYDIIFYGPDLVFYSELDEYMTVNKSSMINVTLYNRGMLNSTNAKLSLYYSNTTSFYCFYEGNCDFKLVETKDVGVVEPGEDKKMQFNFVPRKAEYTMFKILMNDSFNRYPYYSDEFSFYVKEQGPDVSIYSSTYEDFYVGSFYNISINAMAVGTNTSKNVNVSLYENDGYGNRIIIGSKKINSINVSEEKQVNISWKPSKKGYQTLFANVTSDLDVFKYNDEYYFSLVAFKNDIDITADGAYMEGMALLNRKAYGFADFVNYGQDANDIIINVYDNGIKVYQNTLSEFHIQDWHREYFNWTSLTKGKHKITIEAVLEGDSDKSDNNLTESIFVYTPVNITIEVKDSLGNPVSRYIQSNLEFEGNLNGSKFIFECANLSEASEKIGLDVAKLWGYESGVLTSFGVPFNTNISITSEYYEKITQDNRDYYHVFANKINGEYTPTSFSFDGNKNFSEEIYLFTPYYCTQFDFSNKKCRGLWKYAYINGYYESKEKLFMSVSSPENAEAFAIGESKEFNGESTKLENVASNSFTGLVLEKIGYGKIKFLDEVNITRFKINNTILQEGVVIKNKNIFVSDSNMSELKNKKALIMFYNVDLINPKIYRNGAECISSECYNISYNKSLKIYSVNVNGFSEYTIIEGPNCQGLPGECPKQEEPKKDGNDGENKCTPQWINCTWEACNKGIENYSCINECTGKKVNFNSRNCTFTLYCNDLDNDGYGAGPGCLGIDLNDSDPKITNKLAEQTNNREPVKLSKAQKITLWVIAGIIFAILAGIIIFSMINKIKKDKISQESRVSLNNGISKSIQIRMPEEDKN